MNKNYALPLVFMSLIISSSAIVGTVHFGSAQSLATTGSPSTLSLSNFASIAWNRTYGGSDWDSAQSVIQTSEGGYALAGSTASYGAGQGDFWLVKVDSLGNAQWNKTYGGPVGDVAESVIQTKDGGYAVAGHTGDSFWLVKTDEIGNMQWNKTYRGTGSSGAYSIVQTSDGGFAMAGDTNFVPSFGGVIWLVKTDSMGNLQWNKTCGGSEAQSVIQTSDGGAQDM